MIATRIKRRVWRACIVATCVLLAVTYSPLVLRAHVTEPWLFGLPRTLWASLLTAFGIVLVTAIAALVLPIDEISSDRLDTKPDSS